MTVRSSSISTTRLVESRSSSAVLAASISAFAHAALLVLLASAPLELVRQDPDTPRGRALVAFAEIFASSAHVEGMPRVDDALPNSANDIRIEMWKTQAIAPIAFDTFEVADEIASIDDADNVEKLQDLYVRQLSARLGRVLSAHESPLALPPASGCIVTVIQEEDGRVVDVGFDACPLDRSSQRRLHTALLEASPLPAPPAGLAMGSYLKLDMAALLHPPPMREESNMSERTIERRGVP